MSRVMKGSRLQDIAAEVIAKHAPEIVRGMRKSDRIARGDTPSQIYNRSVQQLHQALPAEIAAKAQELEMLTDRVDEMQARVAKLEAKEELNVKETKRLATYRNRLAARVKDYNEAKAALDAKAQKTAQHEAVLEVKEQALKSAVDQLEEQAGRLSRRGEELHQREQDVSRRERILDRLAEDIGKMVSEIAERLGVANSLRAIRDRLKSAREELRDDGPSFG
ncbi:hypothetical protein TRM7557_03660 [Tritonibacter multivorans]|uniref:Uncharacterized protein n=1 Tax=Tritonibacter multivorans TaxID=928856 RepID=A0A0P1GJC1_9RHOB|nr:hypothetical protein [Tritonibacter multivorans]MDA7421688.1 hypothetical protein [Tritonibacter multivorans]CUH81931.1 hypothetical protein TRM7557_03660 [Tritonibacter multivorans]SFC91370.1 hypothetical protein SAMN04488049_1054 [Tritonibacter multivorans]